MAKVGIKTSSGIGIGVGLLSGVGVQYRQFLTKNIGFQVGGPGIGSLHCIGIQTIVRNDVPPNFYLVIGASRFWQNDNATLQIGGGPGLEFTLGKTSFGIAAEIPIIYMYPLRYKGMGEPWILPFPNVAVLFHF